MRSKKTRGWKGYPNKMARLLFFILLVLVLYYLFRFFIKSLTLPRRKKDTQNRPEELVQDLYCQTYIPKGLALKKKVGGQVLYFCSETCLRNYLRRKNENKS